MLGLLKEDIQEISKDKVEIEWQGYKEERLNMIFLATVKKIKMRTTNITSKREPEDSKMILRLESALN